MNLNKNLMSVNWAAYEHFVVNGLSNLYQRDELADVTLFCDGRSFKAHRFMLSMWSMYFKDLFATTTKATSHPHPVIILRETASTDLELILRFIYQGESFVPAEDGERFLKTAKYFKIAGLQDMKILSSTPVIETPPASNSASFPSNATLANSSNNTSKSHNSSINSNGAVIQSYGSTGAPFASVNTVNNNNSPPVIPIRIISNSNSPLSSASSSLHHQHSNSSPVSIISDNASHSQGPFSSNVIKSHIRSHQRQPQPLRSSSPVHQPTHKQSYQQHSSGNINTTVKHSQEGIVYQAGQPVLIVQHQQKVNDFHGSKDLMEPGRATEQVVVVESVGTGNHQMITSLNQESLGLNQSVSNPSGTYTVYNQSQVIHENHTGQEEVLGLAYLHDNTRSPHTQIIQEAAAAAGVASDKSDQTIVNREAAYVSAPTTSVAANSTYNKPNSVVLTTTATPVYAVNRLPPSVVSTVSTESSRTTATTSKQIATNSMDKKFKPKKKKQTNSHDADAGTSTDNNGSKKVEFVNCPKCKKRVKKTSLKVHLKRTHLEEGTVLVCPICNKQISSKGVYYKHMYVHRQKSEQGDIKSKTEPF